MALFEGTEPEVTVEQLVGEGKKYKDVNDLAKSYAHAAEALADRERQIAGLREDLATRQSVEEQFKQFQKATTLPNDAQPNTPAAQPQTGEPKDLAKAVREELDRANRENTAKSNQARVIDRLTEVFGNLTKANQVVTAKARELGVSVQFLESIATQSPEAFYTQLGIQPASRTQTPNTPSRSDVNTQALGLSTGAPREGTYEAFEQLRKENPTRYWDPKTQSKIHKAAMDGTYVVPDPVYDI